MLFSSKPLYSSYAFNMIFKPMRNAPNLTKKSTWLTFGPPRTLKLNWLSKPPPERSLNLLVLAHIHSDMFHVPLSKWTSSYLNAASFTLTILSPKVTVEANVTWKTFSGRRFLLLNAFSLSVTNLLFLEKFWNLWMSRPSSRSIPLSKTSISAASDCLGRTPTHFPEFCSNSMAIHLTSSGFSEARNQTRSRSLAWNEWAHPRNTTKAILVSGTTK